MIEMNAKSGFKIIEISQYEANDLQWGNICDSCNNHLPEARYYVPVLNWGVCLKCATNWSHTSRYELEDKQFETNAIRILKSCGLPYTKSDRVL